MEMGKIKNKRWIFYSVIFLFLYGIMSLLIIHYRIRPLDISITKTVQRYGNFYLDFSFSFLTLLGSIEMSGIIVILLSYFLIRRGLKRACLIFLFLFLLGGFVEFVFKQRLLSIAPSVEFYRGVFGINLIALKTKYSFPSGHIFRTTFLGGVMMALFANSIRMTLWFFLFFFIMGISRIYLGEHWTSDVLGGYFLAGFFVFLWTGFRIDSRLNTSEMGFWNGKKKET